MMCTPTAIRSMHVVDEGSTTTKVLPQVALIEFFHQTPILHHVNLQLTCKRTVQISEIKH